MKWTQPIMVYCSNPLMIQGFMRCYHMLMARWTRNNRCSIRPESEDLVIHRIPTKGLRIKHKWETPCIMETSWRISGKAMLDNKAWTISILNSIMEANHSNKWTTRTSPKRVTEMVPVHSVSTQVVLEATELELLMVWLKIIRLIYSIWWTKEKLQMEARITNNKWWWPPSSSLIQLKTITKCYQAWTHQGRIRIMETLRSLKLLLKLNSESKEPIVVLAIQFNNNMKTACQ